MHPHPTVPPVMKIEVLSHGFVVTDFDGRGKVAIMDFARSMAEYGLVKVGRDQFERKIERVFAGYTADRKEWRFHRNQLQDFINHISGYGWSESQIEFTIRESYAPVACEHRLKEGFTPREMQLPLIAYLTGPCPEHFAPSKVITLQTGKGKMQPLDAKIRTTAGWTTMGQLNVGDMITAPDGSETEVTAIYPHGEKQMYRVTFADGRSTECGAEHLWKVFYINTVTHRRWRVVDTLEMLRLISMPNPRVYVQLIEPTDTPEIPLPVDPYLLGVLLGDGSLCHKQIGLTSADEEIINAVKSLLPVDAKLRKSESRPYDYSISNVPSLRQALREMGVYGYRSWQKAIPSVYAQASIAQRLALLQGLFDTDGTVQQSGSVSYSSTSLELATQVQYLIRSLGGIAALRPRQTSYTHKGEKRTGRICYEVDIRYKRPSELFRLKRKLERVNDNNQYADDLKLRVASIVPSSVKPAQCISVAHPDRLYVTDDFIVTHNTLTTLFAINEIGTRVVVVLPGMYMDQWAKEVLETFEYEPGDLLVIRGTKQFTQLLNAALDDALTAKFIIITTNTWQKYMFIHESTNGNSELVYPVPPDRFYETIGAGIRNIDEVHLNFHCNFRQDLYTHISLTNSLSATLEPEKPMLEKLYDIVWPAQTRGPEVEYDKFISMAVLWYSINEVRRIRCIGPRGYSHTMFEQSILRYKGMTKDYFEMHLAIITREFVSVFEPGQSALVMFATIDMAVKFQEFLVERLPNLNIQRYVRGLDDDYHDNFRKGDIIVSTYKSSGTAVDRPNLRVTFRSMWLSAKEGNIQVLGRTRRLKDWPDVAPRFICISAREIPKHREYTKAIFQKLGGKVLAAHEMQTSYRI